MKLNSITWGHGPVRAVFLHGFSGTSASFNHLEPLLGDVLTATCIDLPGHNGSALADSWDEVVESIGASLDDRTVLVGYSQGARVALAVAQAFPHKLSKLILESGGAGFRRRHDRLLRRQSDGALADLILERGVDAFVSKWEALPLFAGIRALPAVEQDALRSRRSAHTAEGLASALRVMGQGAQPDLWPGLQRLRVPTLLITGSTDEKYTRLAKKMVIDMPLAWRVTFRGIGHAPHLESPHSYADELRSFLAAASHSEPVEFAP